MIEFDGEKGALSAYLAEPAAGQGNGHGIVVLQEYWGLVPHIKDLADRFAAQGYVALAPDMFHGQQTTNPDEAGRLLMALDIARVERDLALAVGALIEQGGARGKVGVVGFCMGGQLALFCATTNRDRVGAVIDFYGIHPNVKPDYAQLGCPVLALFGENDTFVSVNAAKQVVADIEAAGKEVEYHIYSGAGHAFFNDARPEAYNAQAAADAWKRTLAFFQSNLA